MNRFQQSDGLEIEYLGNQVLQATVHAHHTYDNPFWDVTVQAEVTGADGSLRRHDAFWDGGNRWRVRVRAATPGRWDFSFQAEPAGDPGLHGAKGHFILEEGGEGSPFFRHGPLKVADGGTYLAHADGTPFFWLADTAWNALMKAELDDWHHYLAVRRRQGFTAVHSVLTHWFGCPEDAAGEQAYGGSRRITINPAFHQRLDDKVAAVAEHGLLAALVNLWARRPGDPGHPKGLADDDAARLARYQVARYGAYPTVWFLGGDGDYLGPETARWQRLGRSVFGDRPDAVATLHPESVQWVGDGFGGEDWFSFVGYQSGHRDDPERLRWYQTGPPTGEVGGRLPLPIINLEPCYEATKPYNRDGIFGPGDVRRAMYWSLLNAPTAGVSYGHHGIWPWLAQAARPTGHEKSGEAPPWHEALYAPGVLSVTHLKEVFTNLAWHQLRPAPQLLRSQPGDADPSRHIGVAHAEGEAVIIYLPQGGKVTLAHVPQDLRHASWYDPRTGDRFRARGGAEDLAGSYNAPAGGDWLLILR